MIRAITIIAFLISVNGMAQNKIYVLGNHQRCSNQLECAISLYKNTSHRELKYKNCLSIRASYDLAIVLKKFENFKFRSESNDKFINGKINKYHFAVFEKDIGVIKQVDLKLEFQMDKYNNKIALLNLYIPLNI